MSDHADLIRRLRDPAYDASDEAADAIEALVAERDASVALLKESSEGLLDWSESYYRDLAVELSTRIDALLAEKETRPASTRRPTRSRPA